MGSPRDIPMQLPSRYNSLGGKGVVIQQTGAGRYERGTQVSGREILIFS
jgi:hypothetical protein